MLDAIIPTTFYATSNQGLGVVGYVAGVTKNAYLDTTAKTVGYAFLNNIVARFDGTYWKPITDATKILSGDFQAQFSTTAGNISGVSGNGLLYTDTNAPFNALYTPQVQFGVTTWSVASPTSISDRWNTTNICRTRGMLLPRLGETTGSVSPYGGLTYVPLGDSMGSVSGVPSHPSGYTWTAASFVSSESAYWTWNGTNTINDPFDNNRYVRCVR